MTTSCVLYMVKMCDTVCDVCRLGGLKPLWTQRFQADNEDTCRSSILFKEVYNILEVHVVNVNRRPCTIAGEIVVQFFAVNISI